MSHYCGMSFSRHVGYVSKNSPQYLFFQGEHIAATQIQILQEVQTLNSNMVAVVAELRQLRQLQAQRLQLEIQQGQAQAQAQAQASSLSYDNGFAFQSL